MPFDSFLTFVCFYEGYHILVHALPVQVAAQSTFGGVVGRAVGMMYIVDLDNTRDVFDMTLIPAGEEENEKFEKSDMGGTSETATDLKMDKGVSMEDTAAFDESYSVFLKSMQNNDDYLTQETERIIEEARQETNRIMESTHKKLAALNHQGKML